MPDISQSLFLDLAIILLAARLLAVIAFRLGMPTVIGELLAGLVLGPSILGIIELNEVIKVLAEIGVTLLLFEVGLETDAARLVRTGSQSAIVALAGFVLPFFLGFGACYTIFELPLLVSLFVGGTLTATSIGITVRILSDLKRHQTREGQIVLGAAVLDDVLGVVLLALLFEFAIQGNVSWLSVVRIVLFASVFFVVAPLVAKPFVFIVKRWDSLGDVPGVIPTTVVALVLLFAALAHAIGAPEVLGGFAAGLALSRRFFLPFGTILQADQSFAHRVETNVKPIIHLLTPIFFVAVGLSIDLRQMDVGSTFLWAFAGSLLFVGVAGKILAAFTIAGNLESRLMVGIAMVPRGEVGLIFAELGLRSEVFASDLYAALVVVIALTTILPPLVMSWFSRRDLSSVEERR